VKNWEDHYNTIPLQVKSDDYLRQVGKTVAGQTINTTQFELIVNSITNNLKLENDDLVLDLCCGNGLITHQLSEHCSRIDGVDFSKPLIDVAKSVHSPDNCNYKHKSILELTEQDFPYKFTKVFMYEALQHFSATQFETILKILMKIMKPSGTVFLGSIPNKDQLWNFYNSFPRKVDYLKRKIFNNEAIGHWWKSNSVLKVCEKLGMKCTVMNQNLDLYTAHYRFDAVIQIEKN